MKNLTGRFSLSSEIYWKFVDENIRDKEIGLSINFSFSRIMREREALKEIQDTLESNNISWIIRKRDNWAINLNDLRNSFEFLNSESYLHGTVVVTPDIEKNYEDSFGNPLNRTLVRFRITEEEVKLQGPKKIFLSHKGADKPLVREYFSTLKHLGFEPWLDEDAMPAGTDLNRGILNGFKESCAAVFFVSPNFVDEGYLATEVGYAIDQKREKRERFAIITLQLADQDGNRGVVPELLRTYVWKTPDTQLQALQELLRALPISVGTVTWR